MKKRILFGLMTIMVCFVLVGCGTKQEPILDKSDNVQDGQNEDLDNLELYSDDTKIVFNFNNAYQMVYYYSGNKITGQEWYYNYNDSATASYAVASIKAGVTDTDVESVKQKGKYVIVKFNESEYKDLTVEEIRATYSYLEEIKKSN